MFRAGLGLRPLFRGAARRRGARRLAPRAGFEPATIRLTVECSTAELPRNRRTKVRERGAYNKAFRACKGPNVRFCLYPARSSKSLCATSICILFAPGWGEAEPHRCNPVIPRRNGSGRQFDPIGRESRRCRVSWELIRCQPMPPGRQARRLRSFRPTFPP